MMKMHRSLAAIVAVTLSSMGVLLGQTAPQATQPPSTAPAAQQTVVTGCIERADQLTSRDSLGTTVDSLTLVLIRAEEGPASATAVGTAGNTGTSEAQPGIGKIYRLDGDPDALNDHVGHRVEVTGSIMQKPAEGASPAAEARAASGKPDPWSTGTAPLLRVESVKVVSETCPRQ
jgi:hypothetical protein